MTDELKPNQRACDLLADRALVGLTDEEQAELMATLREEDAMEWELAAAAACLAHIAPALQPLPNHIAERLQTLAFHDNVTPPTAPSVYSTWSGDWRTIWGWSGWLAAAACLLWAVSLNRPANVGNSRPTSAMPATLGIGSTSFDVNLQNADPFTHPNATGQLTWDTTKDRYNLAVQGLQPSGSYTVWVLDSSKGQVRPTDRAEFQANLDGRAAVYVLAKPRHPKVAVTEGVGRVGRVVLISGE